MIFADPVYLASLDDVRVLADPDTLEVYGLRDGERVELQFQLSTGPIGLRHERDGKWLSVSELCKGDGFAGWKPYPPTDLARTRSLVQFLISRDRLMVKGAE